MVRCSGLVWRWGTIIAGNNYSAFFQGKFFVLNRYNLLSLYRLVNLSSPVYIKARDRTGGGNRAMNPCLNGVEQ